MIDANAEHGYRERSAVHASTLPNITQIPKLTKCVICLHRRTTVSGTVSASGKFKCHSCGRK